MKLFLKLIKIIIYVFFIIIALLNILLLIQRKLNLNSYSNILGYSILKVETGSMEPTLKTNNYILTKVVEFDDLKEKDIVVYQENNVLVVHRLMAKNVDICFTKGDYNNKEEQILPTQIVAKVINYTDEFSTFISIICNPIVLFGILALGLLIPERIGKE